MARRSRPTAGPLDPRSQAILRAVIEEYVVSATPGRIACLVERYPLGVSSATVRAILADLEAAGLLTHPHTSAGRIPTDQRLPRLRRVAGRPMTALPPVEQLMIRHQFGQVQFASEHWFRLAATTLASVTGEAGLATAGQAGRAPASAGSTSSSLQDRDRQHRPRPARGDDQAGPARRSSSSRRARTTSTGSPTGSTPSSSA